MKVLLSAGALMLGGVLAATSAGASEIMQLSDADLDGITGARLLQTSGGFTPALSGPLRPEPVVVPPSGGNGGGGGQPTVPGLSGVVGIPVPNPDGSGGFVIGQSSGPEGTVGSINVIFSPGGPSGSAGAAIVRLSSEGRGTVISEGITGIGSAIGN